MPASLVTLRGAAANPPGEALPIPPATATGLPVHAAGGELAVLREGGAAAGRTALGRTARGRRVPLALLSFLLVVAVPSAAASAYYFLIAADQYVAEFRFGLRSSEPVRADTGAFLPGSAGPLQTVIELICRCAIYRQPRDRRRPRQDARFAPNVLDHNSRLAGAAALAGVDRGADRLLAAPDRRLFRSHQRHDRGPGARLRAG